MARPGNEMAMAKPLLQIAFAKEDGDLSPVPKDELATFHTNLERILENNASITTSPQVQDDSPFDNLDDLLNFS